MHFEWHRPSNAEQCEPSPQTEAVETHGRASLKSAERQAQQGPRPTKHTTSDDEANSG